jgi:hypothetical protein
MKSCLYIVCAFLICTAAQAAAPTSESIEKLLVVTNSEKMVAAIQVQVDQAMKTGMAQAFKGQNMDADAQKTAEEMGKKLSADMRQDLSWENLKPVYIQVYSETFTQEEIDGLVAFYESPAGKAFVAKMPVVMQKTMVPMMQRMQKTIQDTVQEVKAAKQKKDSEAPAPTSAAAAPAPAH